MLSCDFMGLLSLFGIFVHKVAHTWFVLHETLHTILFGMNYCVEVVRNENDSNMIEITCYVGILLVLKPIWNFLAQSSSNLVSIARNVAHNTNWYILLC